MWRVNALYVHDTLIVSNENRYSDKYCSCIMVTIEELDCIVAAVYRPPDAPTTSFGNMMQFIQSYIDQSLDDKEYDLYIAGDLNLPNICWTDLSINNSLGGPGSDTANIVLDFMARNFLSQVVDKPTRGSNTLDLILTNRTQYICEVQSCETSLSDHNMVSAVLGFDARSKSPRHPNPKPINDHTFYQLNFHEADLEKINEKMTNVDWQELWSLCPKDEDGSSFAELIRLTTMQICYEHCPKKVPPDPTKRPKISRERASLYRRRRKLKGRISCLKAANPSSTKIQPIQDELNQIAYEIQQQIKTDLNYHERRAVDSVKDNPRYFFSYAKRFSKLKSNIGPLRDAESGSLNHNPAKMANILQDQYASVFSDPNSSTIKETTHHLPKPGVSISTIKFSEKDLAEAIDDMDSNASTSEDDIPAIVLKRCKGSISKALLILWTNSLQSGMIPAYYKEQFVVPIHKKGSKTEPENYRPVSLTSHVIKIFERVIRKQLVGYLEKNNLFSCKQHGFRKGRSCLTQLLKHYDYILNNYLNNTETDVIYLDYAKAFDKVDHNLLLKKMSFYGIKGELYTWLKQFLTGRQQTVIVDGHHSKKTIVLSGVPQGTVLGPILFLMFVNDLECCIKDSTNSSFADDTKLSRQITTLQDTHILQTDLEEVIKWSLDNNMQLHEKKFELMCYRIPKNKCFTDALPFMDDIASYTTPAGIQIEQNSLVRDLGVYMSSDFSWTPHINTMINSARTIASWVLGVFKDRSKLIMLQLYKSLVRSRVEYSCPLWDPSKVGDIQTIESIQREFTRRIAGMSNLTYWERLQHLKLQSLQRRRERYSIIHVWKILNGLCPNDINMGFKEHQRNGTRVVIPTLDTKAPKAAMTLYDNSFAVRGGRLWNTLPKEVNQMTELHSFKEKLGSFLNKIPDKPPVRGYSTSNRNSILDWVNQKGELQTAC